MIGTNIEMRGRARLQTLREFSAEDGYCRVAVLPDAQSFFQSAGQRSGLRLFEDGAEIGPADSLHDDIRRLGAGRFSHWGRSLYFSSSDGTPPETNYRTYHALVPASGNEAVATLSALASQDLSAMSVDQRYGMLEQLVAILVPNVHLPEIGRTMFLDEPFRRSYERFSISNYRSYDRKYAMRELVRLALRGEGQLAECGVFKGASAYILAQEIKSRRPKTRLHLFDSFEGLSTPQEVDETYWHFGDMASSLDEVRQNLAEVQDYVVYHRGWIPSCFQDATTDTYSFVHIDVDLYQPTWDALNYFYDRLTRHGILLCDDYGFATCPGASKAFDDFFRERGDHVLHLPTGQGLVIRGLIAGRAASGVPAAE
jgi:hypothetical protein